MDIRQYMLRNGYKKVPMHIYFMGMFVWIYPIAVVIGLTIRFLDLSVWIGLPIVICWSLFWGWKAFKKYDKDKKHYTLE